MEGKKQNMTTEKKINVIDLDGTLLRYNSLTKYTVHALRQWRYFIPILAFSLLRIFRVIPRDVFQKNLLIRMRKTPNYEYEMKKFSSLLSRDMNTSLIQFILENTDTHTTNVLCTASPEDYVRFLASMLRWEYLCSTFDTTTRIFSHLYGEQKISALKQQYPPQTYIYHLAISDSKSDSQLLYLFQKSYYTKQVQSFLRTRNTRTIPEGEKKQC